MNKRLLYLLGIIATILIGMLFYWIFCCCNHKQEIVKQPETKVTTVVTKEEPTKPDFLGEADANGNKNVALKEDLKFKKSSINFVPPASGELDNKISELKDYLVKEDDQSLSIVAYYMSDEVNNSIFPNIGLARAISFKNYVAKKGISTKVIDIEGKLDDNMSVNKDNTIKNPLKLSVGKSKDYSKVINAIIKEIESNPLILNFNSGAKTLDFTHKQRRKIVNISTYLDKVDNAICLITGHTDNTGTAAKNLILGKQRAEFIKQYLTRSGILEDRINTVSKGDTEPIASNATQEGRAKNRRSIVTIN